MHVRDDQPSDGIVRTDRRRLLEAGGVLAGAAALLGNAPAAGAADRVSSAIAARRNPMPTWRPDPTFYPSPRSAMQAPAEKLAYVVRVNPTGDGRPDAIAVVDVDPTSSTYGTDRRRGRDDPRRRRAAPLRLERLQLDALPQRAAPPRRAALPDRARASAPRASTSSTPSRTRPGPRSSRRSSRRRWPSGPATPGHTVHCGPDGIYVSALGAPDGEGPGGIFMLDHDTFDVLGRWEIDRGDQYLHYDFWWHLGYDTMVTSEWGTPEHGRERRPARAAARRPVRPPPALLGPAPAAATCRRSTWARSTRSRSSCGRRTTRPRPTASSTPSSA